MTRFAADGERYPQPCRIQRRGPRLHTTARILAVAFLAARLVLPATARAEDATAPPAPEMSELAPAAAAAKPDGDRVVARVNGVPMRLEDVFGQHLQAYLSSGEHGKETLQAAIQQELLCQYALELGLHRTLEHVEAVDTARSYETWMSVIRLAAMYERQDKDLDKARRELQATDEEGDAYYKEHEKRYKRLGEDRATKSIKRMLSEQKFNAAHKQWLLKIMAEIPVMVNGKEVPHEVLTRSLDTIYPKPDSQPGPMSPGPLASYLTKVTGATGDSADSYSKLARVKVTIGSFKLQVLDLLPASSPLPPASPLPRIPLEHLLSSPRLIYSVRTYILAEKAKQAGVGWAGMSSRLDLGTTKRTHLIMELWRHLGLYPLSSVEVTPEEIEAHIAAYPEKYKQVLARAGEGKVRQMASISVAHEKEKKKRRELIARLMESATIEILDESLR